jgi:hypothetical protein
MVFGSFIMNVSLVMLRLCVPSPIASFWLVTFVIFMWLFLLISTQIQMILIVPDCQRLILDLILWLKNRYHQYLLAPFSVFWTFLVQSAQFWLPRRIYLQLDFFIEICSLWIDKLVYRDMVQMEELYNPRSFSKKKFKKRDHTFKGLVANVPTFATEYTVMKKSSLDNQETFLMTGPIFLDFEFAGILLNEGLTTLCWEQVPKLIHDLSLMEFQIQDLNSVSQRDEFDRLLNYCKTFNYSKLTEEQSYSVQQLLVFTYANCLQANVLPRSTLSYVLVDDYDFISHPVCRMPSFDPKHFARKETHKKVIEPILSYDCSGRTNSLHDFAQAVSCASKTLTMSKLHSIIRSALRTNQDPVEILLNRMFVFSERDLLRNTYTRRDNENAYACSGAYKMAWMISYIPHEWFFYWINTDNEHATSVFNAEIRFWTLFRQSVLQLRANIISYVKHYVEVGKMSTSDIVKYKSDFKESFIAIKRSPNIQLLYMSGVAEDDVNDYIYNTYSAAIKAKVHKAPIFVYHKRQNTIKNVISRLKSRDAKREMQEFDCGECFDTVQMLGSVFHRVPPPTTWAWLASSVAFLTTMIAWIIQMSVLSCRWLNILFRRWMPVFTAAQRLHRNTQNVITETKQFFTTVDGKMSPETRLMYIEFIAVVNIIERSIRGKKILACTHLPYLLVSRMDIIKSIFMSMAAPGHVRIRATYPMIHGGLTYSLTLSQLNSLEAICATYPQGPLRADAFDRFFMTIGNVDIVQADEDFSEWFKPLTKMIFEISDGAISERDVRDMNAHYQYLNNKSAFITEKSKMAKKIISWIGVSLYSWDPFNPDHNAILRECITVVDFTERTLEQQPLLPAKKQLMLEVVANQAKSREIIMNPRFALFAAWLRSWILAKFAKLDKLTEECQNFLRSTTQRDTPVCIMAIGEPGSGKSSVLEYVFKKYCEIFKHPSGSESLYSYNPVSEFHDGYANQPIVLIDDMFKFQDVKISQNESSNLLDMVNDTVYNMNMAFSKGATYFNSELVVITTNRAKNGLKEERWDGTGLFDIQAMLRRLHLVIHRSDPVNKVDLQANIFRVDKCESFPEVVGKMVTPNQIVELVCKLHHLHAEIGKRKRANILANNDLDVNALFERFKTDKDDTRLFRDVVQMDQVFCEKELDALYDESGIIEDRSVTEEMPPLEDTEDEMVDEPIPPPAKQEPFHGLGEQPKSEMTNSEYIAWLVKAKFSSENPSSEITIRKIRFYTAGFFLLTSLSTITWLWVYWLKQPKDETHSSYDPNTYTGARARRSQNKRAKEKEARSRGLAPMQVGRHKMATTQSEIDNFMQCLTNNVAKGCVLAFSEVFDLNTNEYMFGTKSDGFHYRDGIFFLPAHFATPFSDLLECRVTIELQWQNGSWKGDCPLMQFVNDEDCVFFQIPNLSSVPKALKKYFWSADDLAEIPVGTPMKLISLTKSRQAYIRPIQKAPDTGPLTYEDEVGKMFKTYFSINYYEITKCGESGSLVAIEGQQGTPKLIGYHVCVRENRITANKFGFALAVTQESLDELINMANFETFVTQACSADIPFEPLYLVPNHMMHYPPSHSKLRASCMYGWNGPPVSIPALLYDKVDEETGEVIKPLIKAMGKLRTEHTPPIPIKLDTSEALFHYYPRPPEPPIVFDIDQACKGVPGTSMIAINVGTSSGYPYKLGAKKGKSDYMDPERNLTEDMRARILKMEQELKKGNQQEFIFCDSLKDETRPIEKVKAGKTRLISSSPLDHTVLMRMYFGAFVCYVKDNAGKKPVCVGMNPHSIEWTAMYRKMSAKAGSVIAGDFENWDGSVPEFVANLVLKFINEWYDDGEENARVRTLLFYHLTNAIHICFNVVYQTRGSNPTGQAITSELNSFVQCLFWLIVLIDVFKLTPEEFEMLLYGDDSVIAILLKGLTWLDFAPIFFEKFGVKFTHWSKDPSLRLRIENMGTIRFCARMFVVDKYGIVLAPLELRTIVESMYWQRGTANEDMQLISTAENMFLELSHHPKDVFDREIKKFFEVLYERAPDLYQILLERKKTYQAYYNERYHPGTYIDRCQAAISPRHTVPCVCGLDHTPRLPVRQETPRLLQHDHVGRGPRLNRNMALAVNILRKVLMLWVVIATWLTVEFMLKMTVGATAPLSTYSTKEFKILSKDVKFVVEKFLPVSNEGETDRAVKEPGVTQEVPLGAFSDVAPVLETSLISEPIQSIYNQPNMETFDFNHSLDRKYNLANVVWNSSTTAGTVIGSYFFPQVLFNQLYIADKIYNFDAFNAGIQFDIRITASRTTYGKLMVVYFPHRQYYPVDSVTLASYTPPTLLAQKSGHPHMLADASSGDIVSMTVPFISPKRYLTLSHYANAELGEFQIVVVNPLTNSENALSSATVVVTANFVEGKVWIPTDSTVVSASLDRMARFHEKPGSLEEAIRLVQETSGEVPKTEMFKGFDDDEYSLTTQVDEFIDQVQSKRLEAVRKATTVDSAKDSFTPLRSSIKTVKLVGGMVGRAMLNSTCDAAAAMMLGLSKPSSLTCSEVVSNNPNYNLNTGNGIDTSMTLALDCENAIATLPDVAGVKHDELTILNIVQTPVMVSSQEWQSGSAAGILADTAFEPSVLSYVDHVRMMFNQWSGSIKFKLYITASIYHSVRLVFYMARGAAADWQVCYHREVEIQGSSEVEISLPFLPSTFASPCQTTNTNTYKLCCKILSWSQPDNTLAMPIYINVYKSGGSDFKCAVPRDVKYTVQSCPREDFLKDFEPLQADMKSYSPENVIWGEEINTLRQVMHRYEPMSNVVDNLPLIPHVRTTGLIFLGLDMICGFFRFWRGSVRWKVLDKKAATLTRWTGVQIQTTATTWFEQGSGIAGPQQSGAEASAPFYNPCVVEVCNSSAVMYPRFIRSVPTTNGYFMKAAGDDFSLHWLMLPPLGTYSINTVPGTYGTSGIYTHYST